MLFESQVRTVRVSKDKKESLVSNKKFPRFSATSSFEISKMHMSYRYSVCWRETYK